MGTRANGAKLHADARGTEDVAQQRRGEKAPGSRAVRAGAQGAGRAKGGSLTRLEGGGEGGPAWDARAPLAPWFRPAHGGGAR